MSFYEMNRDRKKVKLIVDDTTIDVADCGTYFMVNGSVAGLTVTLPAIADAGPGWWCRFIVEGATAGNDVKIDLPSSDGVSGNGNDSMGAILWGAPGQDYGYSDSNNEGHLDNVAFDSAAKRGSYLEFVCSGKTVTAEKFWYVNGLADGAGSILVNQ